MQTNPVAPSGAPAITPLQSQTTPPGRILVVDDDPISCHLSADVLIRHGYEVNATENSKAAWQELQANHYELLITGHKRSERPGIEFLKMLRGARLTLPVILAVSKLLEQKLTRHPWLQPAVMLRKPYTFEDLLETVRKVLRPTDDTREPIVPPARLPPQPSAMGSAVGTISNHKPLPCGLSLGGPADVAKQSSSGAAGAFQPGCPEPSPVTITLTQTNFAGEVLQSSAPVLVYFWAAWCGSCKVFTPVLDELADTYQHRVKFCRINIDEQPALAAEYDIRAIPTLLLLQQGQVADLIVGVPHRSDIEDSFDRVMA